MDFINYCKWERYELPEDHPEKSVELRGAVFRRSRITGQDWYEFTRDPLTLASPTTWLVIDDEGFIWQADTDPSRINPVIPSRDEVVEGTLIGIPLRDDLDNLRMDKVFNLETGEIEDEIIDLPPPAPSVSGIIELKIEDDQVTDMRLTAGIGFAMAISPGVYWVFFDVAQPDDSYLVFPQAAGFNADVTAREVDYFEITVTDRVSGEAVSPPTLQISVQRIQ